MLTAHELFINWAKGEHLGDDPVPRQPSVCASAERLYTAPSVYASEDEPREIVLWDLHRSVDRFYRAQPLVNKLVLHHEYTSYRALYVGVPRSERYTRASRKIGITIGDYKHRLECMKSRVLTHVYGG